MFGLYSKKDMQRLASRLKEEYTAALNAQRTAVRELKEQNRTLAARVAELENERQEVAGAMLRVEKEGARLKQECERSGENERREFALLAEKCRLLSERMLKKYPDEEDSAAFAAFNDELTARLSGAEEENGFNMDDVLAPKQPLDLGKLCRELGLMEDEE